MATNSVNNDVKSLKWEAVPEDSNPLLMEPPAAGKANGDDWDMQEELSDASRDEADRIGLGVLRFYNEKLSDLQRIVDKKEPVFAHYVMGLNASVNNVQINGVIKGISPELNSRISETLSKVSDLLSDNFLERDHSTYQLIPKKDITWRSFP